MDRVDDTVGLHWIYLYHCTCSCRFMDWSSDSGVHILVIVVIVGVGLFVIRHNVSYSIYKKIYNLHSPIEAKIIFLECHWLTDIDHVPAPTNQRWH